MPETMIAKFGDWGRFWGIQPTPRITSTREVDVVMLQNPHSPHFAVHDSVFGSGVTVSHFHTGIGILHHLPDIETGLICARVLSRLDLPWYSRRPMPIIEEYKKLPNEIRQWILSFPQSYSRI